MKIRLCALLGPILISLSVAQAAPVKPADPCTASRARHRAALTAALKSRPVKLALSVAQGRVIGEIRDTLKAPPSLLPLAQLSAIALKLCPIESPAAAPITEAWLRLAEGLVLCQPAHTQPLQAIWPYAKAMHTVGCPLSSEAEVVGILFALRAQPDLAPKLAPLTTLLSPRPR